MIVWKISSTSTFHLWWRSPLSLLHARWRWVYLTRFNSTGVPSACSPRLLIYNATVVCIVEVRYLSLVQCSCYWHNSSENKDIKVRLLYFVHRFVLWMWNSLLVSLFVWKFLRWPNFMLISARDCFLLRRKFSMNVVLVESFFIKHYIYIYILYKT